MADAPAFALSANGVCKSFDGHPVLVDADLTIERGTFTTLLGPSGCGKTTLLRIIAGLERADAGSVTIDGKVVDQLPANRRPVNTVFQNYALFPHLNVRENIAFGLRAAHVNAAEIEQRVKRYATMLHLETMLDRRPSTLSGGQKQRVAMARALVNQPALLLLDEPMSALDAKLRQAVQVELRHLQRSLGATFIMVTHDQEEAMVCSDQVFLMHEGRIAQAGSPQEIYDRPRTRFAAEFIGEGNFLSATVVDGLLETPIGTLVSNEMPTSWQTGTVLIRPEDINQVRQPPAQNGLHATVREILFRGDFCDVLVDPGPLKYFAWPDEAPQRGDQVWLEIPAHAIRVLDD